ncbi:MAG: nucleotidyltransferase domain-containing protein [Nanoarchaeota archaeon]
MIGTLDKDVIKVLTVFGVSPGSHLKRTLIQEKTNINNIILNKTLFKLVNLTILKKEKNYYYLNFEEKSSKTLLALIQAHYTKLKHLPLREYFIILDIYFELLSFANISAVYLFGSYAKLIFTEKSDIDIAIITEESDKKALKSSLHTLEKRHNKTIELHFFGKDFYKNKRDPLVKDVVTHGVQLI